MFLMLNEWLRQALQSSGVSGSELSRQLSARLGRSIDPAAVSKMQKGFRRISADELLAISDITGVDPPEHIKNPIALIPLLSWVSAGGFSEVESVADYDDLPKIEAVGLPQGEWFALRVEGDSMDRISPPGSLIFVNRRDTDLVPNGCYVIANESGAATYKRYRPLPDRFEPVSLNPTHEPIYPEGEVKIIGRVRRSVLEM